MSLPPDLAAFPATVDPIAAAYVDGSAGDTAGRNEAAWGHWGIVPRVLRDVSAVDPSTTVFGQRWAAPVLLAPWGDHSLVHAGAEIASARGARDAGVGFGLSSSSSRHVRDVGAVGPFLQQVYVPDDRAAVEPFLDEVVRAGAWAIALTVDAPAVGSSLPFRAALAGLPATPYPNWTAGPPPMGSAGTLGPDDLRRVADFTGLPVLAKGVLHPDDATIAIEAGAAGIVVSNHGGRQLAGSVTTAEMLPEVVAAVAGRVPVLVDGGVRDAEDVFRAVALGADAVLIGRPAARALAWGGRAAVASYFGALVTRLAEVMACAGTPRFADVRRAQLRRWGATR